MSWQSVPWTLWHRPTARRPGCVREMVCMFMLIGLA